MDPNNNIHDHQASQELIDAYLLNALDEQEKVEFEKRMKLFPDFRSLVLAQKALMYEVEEHFLKKSLDGYHSEIVDLPTKNWVTPGWMALAASVVILIAVSTWAIFSNGNSPQKLFAENFRPDPGLPTTMSTSVNYDFYYGMVNYKRQEYNEAISRWETIYAANPENDTVVYFLGVANLANGNARQAKKYLQAAQEKPASAFFEEAQYYLALTLLKENKLEEARQLLTKSTSPASVVLLKKINAH